TVTICEHYLFDMPYHEPQKFPPTADFDYSINDTTQCIEFNADCKCWWQTQPTTYSWVFGNGVTTSGQNISIDLAENGQYNVQLIASNIYGSDTIVKTIEISSFPQANYSISDSVVFLPNANVLFSNQTTNAVSYLWDFGDSIQSNEMSPVHVYQDSCFYSVTLISCNSFGCCDTLIKQNLIEVKNPNSINNLNNNLNNFQIFPNPSNGIVTIKTTNEAIETIEVFNCIGNKTDEIIVKGNNSSYIYNSKNMNGLYFIKVKTRENVYAGKVILQ
ncbi:MAG: PKD domain-containing protein, partial [Bacteroidetes bacterium]|nr:PKD domain-containing protein [Bacteroidota bacterium]